MFSEVIKGFLILSSIFITLELIFPLHQQKILRPGWQTDTLYYFTGNLIGKLGLLLSSAITLVILGQFINPELQNLVASQPLIFQLLEAIFIAEICYYIAHRLLHTIPFLWQFHAIHHSSEYLDWLATIRVHPCEQILTKLFQLVPIYYLGFNVKTLTIYFLFSAAIAFFIHANIKVKFPILRWLIVTPEYHHWHHNNDPKLGYHNFTAQIPIIDLLFGTFYLPNNQKPKSYGISYPIPNNYLSQLIYPFKGIFTMVQKLLNKIRFRPSKIDFIFVGLILIIGAAFQLSPMVTNMSLPTFISSLSTETISINELKNSNLKNVILIDVRTSEEYEEDHIGNSLLIPLTDIEQGLDIQRISSIVKSHTKSQKNPPKLILYCTSGKRSIQAYKDLEVKGIHTFVLAGGITAWRKSITPEQDTTIIH